MRNAPASINRTETLPCAATAERFSMAGRGGAAATPNAKTRVNARRTCGVFTTGTSWRLAVCSWLWLERFCCERRSRGLPTALCEPRSGGLFQDLRHELRVQRVAGAVRGDLAGDRASDQGEVADEVEHFVAHELVLEAQRSVHDVGVVEHDRVLHRAAPRQSRGAHLLDVAHEAERARRRDLAEEVVVSEIEVQILPSDQRMIEVDAVFDDQAVRGNDADALVAVDHFDRLPPPPDRHYASH